ncbi:MAG: hypothetical protein JXX28_10015 [Deltaproteobacteria bacterium]|nr:hypothetical protein [Deltaproteobacteria bacterium]
MRTRGSVPAVRGVEPTVGAVPDLQAKPMDGRVDPFMAEAWDDSDYRSAIDSIGGIAVNVVGEPMTPIPAPNDMTSAAVSTMGALATGGLDMMIMLGAKLIPGVGILPYSADAVKDAYQGIRDHQATEVENSEWDELVTAVDLTRTLLDWAALSSNNLADLCVLVQDGAVAGALETLGISLLGEVAAVVSVPLRTMSTLAHGMKPILDLIMIAGNLSIAREHEASGNLAAAELARDMAADSAGLLVSDVAQTVAGIVSLASVNHLGGGEQVVGAISKGGASLAKIIKLAGGVAASGADALTGLALGGEDDMVQGQPLQGSGPAATILAPARQGTLDGIASTKAGLSADRPLWHQDLINQFAEGQEPGSIAGDIIESLDSPSTWAARLLPLELIPTVGELLSGISAEDVGNVLRSIATVGGVISPIWDGVEGFIQENKGSVDDMLDQLSEMLLEQDLSLAAVDDGLNSARELIDRVGSLTDFSSDIGALISEAILGIESQKVDPKSVRIPAIDDDIIRLAAANIPVISGFVGFLGGFFAYLIPDWVDDVARAWLEQTIQGAMGWYNDALTGMIQAMGATHDHVVVPIDELVEGVFGNVDQVLVNLQDMFGEGSEARQLIQEQYDDLAGIGVSLVEAFKAWDGSIVPDWTAAAKWLGDFAITVDDYVRYLSDASNGKDLDAQWAALLANEAQPEVDSWKAAHAEEVDDVIYPGVPEPEREVAVEASYQVMDASEDEGVDATARRVQRDVKGLSGRGVAVVRELWSSEEDLVAADATS